MPKLASLIEAYLAGPAELRSATQGMSPAQLVAQPIAGKMSTLEVVCHIADFEPIYVDRMKRVIALDHPTLLGADENRFRAALAYQQRDLAEELAVVECTRIQMARILRVLPESALERSGLHDERGELTLGKLLTSITAHLSHHVRFIHDKRMALGLS